MILRLLIIAASAFAIPVSQGFEAQLAAGLTVTIDRIPEPVAVDGIPMTVHRVTGAGVPELARRIEAQWRSQGSEVKALQQGSWTLRSRMLGAKSEVVQWRNGPEAPELLWSSLDATGPLQPKPDAGLALPAGCVWGRSVSGSSGPRRYLQRSARCTLSVHELSLQLQHSLPSQGWRLRSATDRGLLLDRPGVEALLSLDTHQGEQATWLTWLRVEHSR